MSGSDFDVVFRDFCKCLKVPHELMRGVLLGGDRMNAVSSVMWRISPTRFVDSEKLNSNKLCMEQIHAELEVLMKF